MAGSRKYLCRIPACQPRQDNWSQKPRQPVAEAKTTDCVSQDNRLYKPKRPVVLFYCKPSQATYYATSRTETIRSFRDNADLQMQSTNDNLQTPAHKCLLTNACLQFTGKHYSRCCNAKEEDIAGSLAQYGIESLPVQHSHLRICCEMRHEIEKHYT